MKNFKILLILFLSILMLNCGSRDDSDNEGSTIPQITEPTEPIEPIEPIEPAEKIYAVNPLPDAEFFYFTESGKFYKYNNGEITTYNMTITISQEGQADIIQTIIPAKFYRLGLYYNFEFNINGETKLYNQIKGENKIYEVEKLWRHPDKIHVTMNNGRFSIEINTYDIYTVSDIRNLTHGSGIARTLLCSNYYLGDYNNYNYGLFFVAEDDGLSLIKNGLYFWPENDGSYYKIIDEKGEMW